MNDFSDFLVELVAIFRIGVVVRITGNKTKAGLFPGLFSFSHCAVAERARDENFLKSNDVFMTEILMSKSVENH
ncbi:hypothetical protein [Serratia marcescens]|uniref:hypothetical protein n=1 Tax=Serratia marcescens TaxID=615 RepID=UPI0034D74A1C